MGVRVKNFRHLMKNSIWSSFVRKHKSEEKKNLDILSKIPIFEDISSKGLVKIERNIHVRHYDEGELVFREGEPGVGMYMVKEGEVNVTISDPETNEDRHVATFTSGQAFGDVALFSEEAVRTATVRAVKKSTLLGFCRPDLLSLIKRDPHLGSLILTKLLSFAGDRLDEGNKQINIARKRIKELEEKLDRIEDNA